MNKVLIFGSSIVAAMGSEAGPAAERKLAAFDADTFQGVGATAGTGVATGICNFRPTSEVLARSYLTTGTETANGVYSLNNGGSGTPFLQEGSVENIVGQVSVQRWQDNNIMIARFKPKFQLVNYDALAKDATKNYKYYSFGPTGANDALEWSAFDGDNNDGIQQMADICVCKPKNVATDCTDVCGTDSDTLIVRVTDGGSAGVAGTPVQLKLGLRKIIGVTSLCGTTGATGGAGDKHGDITANSDDIFVWGMFDAHDEFTFTLTQNAVVDHDSLTQPEDDLTGYNAIEYTLTMGTHDVDTYDLLFIEEPQFESIANLYTDHGASNDDADTYKIESHTGYVTSGGISVTGENAVLECAVTLSVKSQVSNHYHCFRDAAAKRTAASFESGVDTTEDGSTALAAFDITNDYASLGTAATINAACSAKLDVNCEDAASTITGTDARQCDLSHNYNDGNGANAPQAVDMNADFNDCVTSSWFTNPVTLYDNQEVFDGNYQAAVVQAVRLANARRYPKDAKNLAPVTSGVFNNVQDKFGTTKTTAGDWQCDTNNCATADPYVVLDTSKVTVNYKYVNGVGPFLGETLASGDPTNLQGSQTSAYVAVGQLLTDTDTSTLDCTKASGEGTISTADGCDYSSGDLTLAAPPVDFPETYVFGIASFDFSSALGVTTGNSQELVNPTGVSTDPASATRRLRSSSNNVQKSFFVVATSNNILK